MDGKAAEIKLEGVTDPRRAGESLNRPDESKLSSGRSLLSPFGLASPALASSCAVRCPAGMVGRGKPCAALSDGWLNAPTKRLLLEERPFGRLSPQLSQIATPDFRTQSCPRGTLIADQRRACAARPKGKKAEARGRSLLQTGRFKFFPATGSQAPMSPPSFIQSTFTSHTGSLVLSLYAPRYCLTASAGFGRQFTKLRALSRLRRRYGSKKVPSPLVPLSPPAPSKKQKVIFAC